MALNKNFPKSPHEIIKPEVKNYNINNKKFKKKIFQKRKKYKKRLN